jgi:hypothetical protein
MNKFSFFGPSEKHFVPSGGFCISAFAIARKKEDVLVLRPAKHEKWEDGHQTGESIRLKPWRENSGAGVFLAHM